MRLAVATVLLSVTAFAGGFDTFSGTGRNGASTGGGTPAPLLPTTFAWYGDSIAAGACSPRTPTLALQALLNSGDVAGSTSGGWAGSGNAGDGAFPAVGGYTAAQIRARYFATRDTACAGERCGSYLIEGGINSLVNGATVQSTLDDMTAIAVNCRSLNRLCIWSNIMPCRGSPNCDSVNPAAWTLAKQYNAAWTTACTSISGMNCVDVGAGSSFEKSGTDGYLPDAFTCDGIHLTQTGTDAWVTLVRTKFPQ